MSVVNDFYKTIKRKTEIQLNLIYHEIKDKKKVQNYLTSKD